MLQKKKGFTLIELLAVIVILAVIALIATPLIMNVINDAKKNSFKDSAYGIIKAVELRVMEVTQDPTITSGPFKINVAGTAIDYSGEKPTSGWASVDRNGNVTLYMTNDTYWAYKDSTTNKEVVVTSNSKESEMNAIVSNPSFKEITQDGIEDSTVEPVENMPSVGDNIKLDGMGNYIVFAVSGNNVSVIDSLSTSSIDFDTKLGNDLGTQAEYYVKPQYLLDFNGDKVLKYSESTLDDYLNNTYYNSLSNHIKSAIVEQDAISSVVVSSTSNDYDFKIYSDYRSADSSFHKIIGEINSGRRKVRALSIDDLIALYGQSSLDGNSINNDLMLEEYDTLQFMNVSTDKENQTYSRFIYSAYGQEGMNSNWTDPVSTKPVFSVDLSKVEFELR